MCMHEGVVTLCSCLFNVLIPNMWWKREDHKTQKESVSHLVLKMGKHPKRGPGTSMDSRDLLGTCKCFVTPNTLGCFGRCEHDEEVSNPVFQESGILGFQDSRFPKSQKGDPHFETLWNTKQKRRGIVNSPNWGNANPNKCMLAWIAPPFHFVLKTFCNQNVCKGS